MAYTAAVITVSDLGSRGQRVDTSGPAICAMLEKAGFTVTYTAIVPDEIPQIQTELTTAADGDRKSTRLNSSHSTSSRMPSSA